jgi:protein-L-isoaspartate(D-aspartate) O-methyltransferase
VVTARLIQAADIGTTDRVLVVGNATGYSAAVVSRLAGAVGCGRT